MRRLVVKHARQQWRGADVVAGRDHHRIRVRGPQPGKMACQIFQAAGLDRADPAVASRGRLQPAVEIVERQQLHVDRIILALARNDRHRREQDGEERREQGSAPHAGSTTAAPARGAPRLLGCRTIDPFLDGRRRSVVTAGRAAARRRQPRRTGAGTRAARIPRRSNDRQTTAADRSSPARSTGRTVSGADRVAPT